MTSSFTFDVPDNPSVAAPVDAPAFWRRFAAAEPGADGGKLPWAALLGYRQTWSFILAKFLTDPVWWFFLIWLPDYFNKTKGLDIKKLGLPLVAIYDESPELAGPIGSDTAAAIESGILRGARGALTALIHESAAASVMQKPADMNCCSMMKTVIAARSIAERICPCSSASAPPR